MSKRLGSLTQRSSPSSVAVDLCVREVVIGLGPAGG
jgi:hypothetical protein